MDEAKTVMETAKTVSPFGYEIYGFVIMLLLLMVIALAWQYRRKEKLYEALAEQAIKAITLFVHETSGSRVEERNKLFLIQIEQKIAAAIEKKLTDKQ